MSAATWWRLGGVQPSTGADPGLTHRAQRIQPEPLLSKGDGWFQQLESVSLSSAACRRSKKARGQCPVGLARECPAAAPLCLILSMNSSSGLGGALGGNSRGRDLGGSLPYGGLLCRTCGEQEPTPDGWPRWDGPSPEHWTQVQNTEAGPRVTPSLKDGDLRSSVLTQIRGRCGLGGGQEAIGTRVRRAQGRDGSPSVDRAGQPPGLGGRSSAPPLSGASRPAPGLATEPPWR